MFFGLVWYLTHNQLQDNHGTEILITHTISYIVHIIILFLFARLAYVWVCVHACRGESDDVMAIKPIILQLIRLIIIISLSLYPP